MNISLSRSCFFFTPLLIGMWAAGLCGQEKAAKLASFSTPARVAEATNAPNSAPHIQVCFVLDTTGSMGGEISALRAGLNTIATQTRARIGDAAFGAILWLDAEESGEDVDLE